MLPVPRSAVYFRIQRTIQRPNQAFTINISSHYTYPLQYRSKDTQSLEYFAVRLHQMVMMSRGCGLRFLPRKMQVMMSIENGLLLAGRMVLVVYGVLNMKKQNKFLSASFCSATRMLNVFECHGDMVWLVNWLRHPVLMVLSCCGTHVMNKWYKVWRAIVVVEIRQRNLKYMCARWLEDKAHCW